MPIWQLVDYNCKGRLKSQDFTLIVVDNECVVTFGADDFHISCMLWDITNKWYVICVCIIGYTCAHLAAAHGKRSVLEAIMKAGVVSSETCR